LGWEFQQQQLLVGDVCEYACSKQGGEFFHVGKASKWWKWNEGEGNGWLALA